MLSFGNIALIILVFLVLFGAKKIPEFMANLAIGIKSFKKAMESDDTDDSLLKIGRKSKKIAKGPSGFSKKLLLKNKRRKSSDE